MKPNWKQQMRNILGVFLLTMAFGVQAQQEQNEGIQFNEENWEDILQLAQAENKGIFLDVYASWCGPCKALKSRTFPNEKAGQFFNENFINVSMDAEKGEGIQLARQLKVDAYPSLFFLNSKGEAVLLAKGYHNAEELIELGKEGLSALQNLSKNE